MGGAGLEDADGGGANGHEPGGGADGLGGGGGDLETLAVHGVIGDLLGLDRPEGPCADVQGDEDVGYAGEDGRGEVKSGGRGGDGAGMAREDGLVTLGIGGVGWAAEVGGDGELADAVEIDRGGELDEAFAGGENLFDLAGDAADGG